MPINQKKAKSGCPREQSNVLITLSIRKKFHNNSSTFHPKCLLSMPDKYLQNRLLIKCNTKPDEPSPRENQGQNMNSLLSPPS